MLGKHLRKWWVVALLAVFSLGAAERKAPLPLIEAIKGGEVKAVRVLLQQRIDVNAAERDGSTALHWAVHRNDLDTVDLLIRADANVRAMTRYGVTPLWLACINGNAPIVERLLDAGADPNTTMAEGDTALMTAARSGNADVVKALLARGADVNAREGWKGQTALMWAAAENHAAVAELLIKAGADIRARTKYSPYKTAATLTRDSEGGFTPLLFAARAGQIDAIRVLLAAGANVNEPSSNGTSPLVMAVASAEYDAAAFLLDNGTDPDADWQGWTALHQVVWTSKPNTGLNNPYPLPRGTLNGLAMAKALLEHGANPNARLKSEPDPMYTGRNSMSQIGATPFLLAAKNVDVPMMRLFLEYGADLFLPNEEETTPLMAAAGVGIWAVAENPGTAEEATEAVQLCLELGGDVTTVDVNGHTALHGAAFRGANEVVRLLVDRGAKLDVKIPLHEPRPGYWEGGWTPWRVAKGVYMNAGLKSQLHTAPLLRQLMEERGIPVDETDEAADRNFAQALATEDLDETVKVKNPDKPKER